MSFDELTDRASTISSKWRLMERATGVSAPDGLPMWIADMDFRSPAFVTAAAQELLDAGFYGYFCKQEDYIEAIVWWMKNRHGWPVEPTSILTTAGLGHAIGVCCRAFSDPGDDILIFTPVYDEFEKVITQSGRRAVECQLAIRDGVYVMDLPAYDALVTPRSKAVLLSSPHNPAGRVWSRQELRALADFCTRHDLLLISDEIHQDLVFEGHSHIPMPVAAPEAIGRTIVLTAASKTFNIAGTRTGNMIIPDGALRRRANEWLRGINVPLNIFGSEMVKAAYSPQGAAWVDALVRYIEVNQRAFEAGVGSLPGVSVMPMQSTYLSWVDFSGTGMEMDEIIRRVVDDARIGPKFGPKFGKGGDGFLRFNIGTQRARIDEAVTRLRHAFRDLQ